MDSQKQYADTFLSDIERELLIQLNNNPVLINAIKKVILAGTYRNGVMESGKSPDLLRNFAFDFAAQGEHTDEEIGQDVRAKWLASNAIELGFNIIAKYKKEIPEDEKKKVNPAR